MNIWVDADSCPVKIRDIISKASLRLEINSYFVANRDIPVRKHDYMHKVVTPNVEQSADQYIVDNVKSDDIVITRDIPLADQLVTMDVTTINDRGNHFTKENIKERLSIRDFMQEARELGLKSETTSRFNQKDIQNFANTFDKLLRALTK